VRLDLVMIKLIADLKHVLDGFVVR
jgi:hypothetical protein